MGSKESLGVWVAKNLWVCGGGGCVASKESTGVWVAKNHCVDQSVFSSVCETFPLCVYWTTLCLNQSISAWIDTWSSAVGTCWRFFRQILWSRDIAPVCICRHQPDIYVTGLHQCLFVVTARISSLLGYNTSVSLSWVHQYLPPSLTMPVHYLWIRSHQYLSLNSTTPVSTSKFDHVSIRVRPHQYLLLNSTTPVHTS